MKPTKSCILRVVLVRDESIPDQWVAHCLDLDVVSQGETFAQAMDAIREAVVMVVNDDIAQNRDPLKTRTPAPEECWDTFLEVMKVGQPIEVARDEEPQVSAAACAFQLTRHHHPVIDGDEDPLEIPPAWLLGAMENRFPSAPCFN